MGANISEKIDAKFSGIENPEILAAKKSAAF